MYVELFLSFCEMSHQNHRCRVCGKCEHLRCLGHPLKWLFLLRHIFLPIHISATVETCRGFAVEVTDRFRCIRQGIFRLICMSENEFDVRCSKFVRMTGRALHLPGINASDCSKLFSINRAVCVCVCGCCGVLVKDLSWKVKSGEFEPHRSFTLRHWAPGSSGGIVCVSCQSLQSLSWTLILVELCLAKGPKQLHIKHRISSDRVWLG